MYLTLHADPSSISEPASQCVNHFIKPFVSALPSYIQDTAHVHTRTDEIKNIGDAFMVTMDVTFLYSNIKQEECFEAVNHFLQSRTNDNPPNEFILMLTEWTQQQCICVPGQTV